MDTVHVELLDLATRTLRDLNPVKGLHILGAFADVPRARWPQHALSMLELAPRVADAADPAQQDWTQCREAWLTPEMVAAWGEGRLTHEQLGQIADRLTEAWSPTGATSLVFEMRRVGDGGDDGGESAEEEFLEEMLRVTRESLHEFAADLDCGADFVDDFLLPRHMLFAVGPYAVYLFCVDAQRQIPEVRALAEAPRPESSQQCCREPKRPRVEYTD
jgi:hypothetical protein